MATTVNSDELIPQRELEAVDYLIKGTETLYGNILKLVDVSQKVRLSSFDDKSLMGAATASDRYKRSTDELTIAIKEYETLNKQRAITQAKLSVIETDEAKQLMDSRKALSDKKKEIEAIGNAYKQFTNEVNKSVAAAKSAMAAEVLAGKATHEWSAETIQLVANAQRLQTQLIAVERTVGDNRRQVGNYNIIAQDMGRILQDTSSFAYGLQQGLMGVGNNIFVVLERMKMMRSEGMGWGEITKQMGLSLVSPINLLTIGINVLTIWAGKLNDSKDSTEDATKANKEYADSISSLINKQRQANTARGAFTDIGTKQAEKQLELMKAQGASTSAIAAQEKVVAERKKRDLQNEIDAYEKLEQTIRDAFDYYIGQGYKNDVVREKIAADKDVIKSLKQVTGVSQEEAEKQAIALGDIWNTGMSPLKQFNQKQIELKNQQKEIDIDLQISAAERHKDSLDKQTEEDKKYNEIRKALLADLAQSNRDAAKLYLEIELRDQESIIQNEKSTADEKIAAYNKYLTAKLGLLTLEKQETMAKAQAEYFAEIEKIDALLVAENRKRDLRLLAEKKFQQELQAIQNNYEVKAYDAQMDASEGIAKNTQPIGPNKRAIEIAKKGIADYQKYRKKWEEQEKRDHDELIRRKIQNLQAMRQASDAVFNAIQQISENSTKRDVARIQQEIKTTDEQAERQKKAVEKSTLSAEEKEQRMADIDARAEQRKNLLQQQEANRQQRQADFEKGMAILKATIALYVGIAQEIEKGGVIGIATGAAVAAYMATVIATLSSTSVPSYAEGTDSHPGGWALVGEGKKNGNWVPEFVDMGNGGSFWTKGPMLVDLPKDTSVTPIDTMSNAMVTPHLVDGTVSNDSDMRHIANLMAMGFEKIASNQSTEVKFILKNGELIKTVKKGNNTTTYYNAHNK